MTIRVHALTRAFDEVTATWLHAASGVPWTTPGGDYSNTVLSELTVVPSTVQQGTKTAPIFMTFDSTDNFVAAATAAYNGDKVLRLILVAADDKTFTTTRYVTVRSDDTGDDIAPDRRDEGVIRPRLFVSYQPTVIH